MIESSSENSIIDLEKSEYKRQNAINDDESAERLLLNNNVSNGTIKIECIYISVMSISLVAIVITILILNGTFSS